MKNKRSYTHRGISTPLALILTLLLVAPGVAPAATAGEASPARETARVGQPDAGTAALAGLTADEQATILDLIRQADYQFVWQVIDGVGAYRAANRANDLSLSLAADGFHAIRYGEGELLWEFGLSLAAHGAQTFPPAIAEGDLVGSRERVEYHWSEHVVEWYTNSAEGIEHGLTLVAPPPGADGAAVELTFALRGSLAPELDGGALHLKDAGGETVLRYDQLTVYDATGRALPAHFSLSPGGEGESLHITIDAAGAVYPLTVDPLIHAQVKKLVAFDAEDEDNLGWSVAVSGDTVVVGAYREDGELGLTDRGAVYIFVRNKFGADIWGQEKKLLAVDGVREDFFGYSVAISGDTVVVGAPYKDDVGGTDCVTGTSCGAAYIFERNQGGADNWGQVTRINSSYANEYEYFGWSVAISNDTVVVGAPYADTLVTDGGLAHVFERNQGGVDAWGQVRMLMSLSTADSPQFGHSVAISSDTVVVGAWTEDDAGCSNCGAAYLFERNRGGADNWTVAAKLTAPDAADEDLFGSSVAISGDTVVVGAWGEDGGGSEQGAAYVFERNQGGADDWGQVTKLTAWDAQNNDFFGWSVAISVDTIVVGAMGEDGAGNDCGAAYVFERNRGGADGWGRAGKLAASDAENGDHLGNAVAISGDTIVAGAPGEDGASSNSNRGAAYLFAGRGGRWLEIANPHVSDAGDEDRFGYSVAISGDTAVVGAEWWEGSSGSNIGAAYVLERNEDGADGWGQVKRILAADGASGDFFGCSVAISGDTIVVGAYSEDGAGTDRGAAYVFERNYNPNDPTSPLAENWGQVAKLTALHPGDDESFGYSVGISDDTIVVGAPWEEGATGMYRRGAIYIFARNEGGADSWGYVIHRLAAYGAAEDYFGYSVAISGDTVVAGAYGNNGAFGTDRGAAYIFERNEGPGVPDDWGQVTTLLASDTADYDRFGYSVAIDNDTIVVGAYGENGTGDDYGAAYVFERNQGGTADNWGEVAKLTASDAQDNDFFGCSVAVSDDTAVVGAYGENGAGFLVEDRGAAYVFERNQADIADNWGQVTRLRASDAANNDYFGYAVAISGDQILIGAYGKNAGGTDRGAAYVFVLQPYKNYLPLVSNNS